MELMMHAPIWWYVWLGVVLLFGVISILRWQGGRPQHLPEQHIPGRLATSDTHLMQLPDRNDEVDISDEIERAGGDQQVTAAALDEGVYSSRYAMALAIHDPSFSPGAPVSPLDAGGPAHMDA
jgi:hypothetical protein